MHWQDENAPAAVAKETTQKAPFFPGDSFSHDDAPMTVKVIRKNADLSYTVEIEVK